MTAWHIVRESTTKKSCFGRKYSPWRKREPRNWKWGKENSVEPLLLLVDATEHATDASWLLEERLFGFPFWISTTTVQHFPFSPEAEDGEGERRKMIYYTSPTPCSPLYRRRRRKIWRLRTYLTRLSLSGKEKCWRRRGLHFIYSKSFFPPPFFSLFSSFLGGDPEPSKKFGERKGAAVI